MRVILQSIRLVDRVTTDGAVRKRAVRGRDVHIVVSGRLRERDLETTNLDRSRNLTPSKSQSLGLKSLGLSLKKSLFLGFSLGLSLSLSLSVSRSLSLHRRCTRLGRKLWVHKQGAGPSLGSTDQNRDLGRESLAVEAKGVLTGPAVGTAGNTAVAQAALERTAGGLIVLVDGAVVALGVGIPGARVGVEDNAAAPAAIEASDSHFLGERRCGKLRVVSKPVS